MSGLRNLDTVLNKRFERAANVQLKRQVVLQAYPELCRLSSCIIELEQTPEWQQTLAKDLVFRKWEDRAARLGVEISWDRDWNPVMELRA